MQRKIVTISLPPNIQAFVERRVKEQGYSSTSEYFRELIRRDQRVERNERSYLEPRPEPGGWQPYSWRPKY